MTAFTHTYQSFKLFRIGLLIIFIAGFNACKKDPGKGGGDPLPASLSFTVNDLNNGTLNYTNLGPKPVVKFTFTEPINPATIPAGVKLSSASLQDVEIVSTLQNDGKLLTITPKNNLGSFATYTLVVNSNLKTTAGGVLTNPITVNLKTGFEDSDKFPRITDEELLTLVQRQTFKYFWDFAHPVSGLARERNTSGETVTSGGSGFGIMALVVGIERNFITRAEGLARMQKIVDFLKNKAQRFHGAYPHWLNGTSGAALPFSAKDNGADLVETSYLIQGLLTARQYFNGADVSETTLRNDINTISNGVEWSWFRKENENTLYWHWSADQGWAMNVQIRGWNECLITYVMAASSTTYTIPKEVYDQGWARNGAMVNGNSYYGVQLPLGPANGGPLFLAHYSFLGIDPNGLTDAYANYGTQVKAHTLINYNYCKSNTGNGYSDKCWGLTASDINGGYTASSPSNDVGVIAPTAALSSMPYTPAESMEAMKFFYYKLGDKLWGNYGFYDAFSMKDGWFATSTLAIDQGPIIIMIENHRSKLLWNLFMSCPEVKTGMKKLGFQGPRL